MGKKGLILTTLLILAILPIVAAQTQVEYFYSTGCSHCANVAESGVLEEVANLENVTLEKYNVMIQGENQNKFFYYTDLLKIGRGVPLVVIKQGDEISYLNGDKQIIENLKEKVTDNIDVVNKEEGIKNKLEKIFINEMDEETGKLSYLGWLILITIALIDAINPCAFGVLVFLMASLLKMGSSKRALRAGLIYSFVIFLTYFLVGIVLYNVVSNIISTTYFYYFYLLVGLFLFILGLLQLKDVFWYGKGLTLRIPQKAKPTIEKLILEGSFISLIVLGVLVSLFELPCTGEVYFGIITIMASHQLFAISYFLVYNLIFVLPLIILTFLVYKGTSTKRLSEWTNKNKKFMKLISGLLLIGLAAYILFNSVGFI